MGILESMNNVIKSCKEQVFSNPSRLKEISYVIRDVLKKKVRGETSGESASFVKARLMKQEQEQKYFLGDSHASNSLLISLSIQTVCQDGGGDESDEEDQQVGIILLQFL